jgi:hypothetical protein
MTTKSNIKDELGIPVTINYDDLSVSTDLPIPPVIIEESMKIIEQESEKQFNEIKKISDDIREARSKIEPIIETIDEIDSFNRFYGIDGGIGFPSTTIGGTYSSAVGVAYTTNEKLKPFIRLDPINIPAGLGAPHQNYLQMWMKKYESLVAVKASQKGDCLFLDGTLVPSIFARYLRSARDYELLRPAFLTMFRETFVSSNEKKCLVEKLIECKTPIVGLPKRSRSRNIINDRLSFMNLPLSVSDLMACSILLEPGEYISPMDYKTLYMEQAENDEYAKWHWDLITKFLKDVDETPKIAGLNESVETIPYLAENTFVTYFKPIAGSIAIRVEILEKEKPNLEKILNTIKKDFDKVSRLPFCVLMADRYSKSSNHIPIMIQISMESKLIRLAREKGVTDDEFLWFINTMFSSLGSQDV